MLMDLFIFERCIIYICISIHINNMISTSWDHSQAWEVLTFQITWRDIRHLVVGGRFQSAEQRLLSEVSSEAGKSCHVQWGQWLQYATVLQSKYWPLVPKVKVRSSVTQYHYRIYLYLFGNTESKYWPLRGGSSPRWTSGEAPSLAGDFLKMVRFPVFWDAKGQEVSEDLLIGGHGGCELGKGLSRPCPPCSAQVARRAGRSCGATVRISSAQSESSKKSSCWQSQNVCFRDQSF